MTMLDQQTQQHHNKADWKAELERLGPERVRMMLSRPSTSIGEFRLFDHSAKINPNRADVNKWLAEKRAAQEEAAHQLADQRHEETIMLGQKTYRAAIWAIIVGIVSIAATLWTAK
jgi:hypothetical protein